MNRSIDRVECSSRNKVKIGNDQTRNAYLQNKLHYYANNENWNG